MEPSQPDTIQIDAGNNLEPQVSLNDAAIKDKKAYYELLVRAGWYLPKLSSKFINQRSLLQIRDKKLFTPMQEQIVFRICSTPPKKEVMVDKYISYCSQHNLVHGIDKLKPNFPDKEYLILSISTFSAGKDEIFARNYYPILKQPRINSNTEVFLGNKDGFLSNIPQHLLGQRGSRTMKLNTLSKEDKLRLKVMRAEELMKKQSDKKAKLELEIQSQKIQKALFGNGQFDVETERQRLKAEMQKEFELSAANFVQQKEAEMQAEFNRQLSLAQLSESSVMKDGSRYSTKQISKVNRLDGGKMAPFPNTIQNLEDMGDGTYDNLM